MQKERSLIKLLSFCIVEFILQDGEVGRFDHFYLTSVLLLPFSDYR